MPIMASQSENALALDATNFPPPADDTKRYPAWSPDFAHRDRTNFDILPIGGVDG
jgi:hypothetical protein